MTVVTHANAEVPLAGPLARASASPTELRDAMRSMSVQHEVEPLTGLLDGLATGARLGDVHLAFVRYGAPARVVAAPTGSLVCWTVPLGPMGVSIGGQPPSVRTEGFLLAPDDFTTMLPSPERGAVVITASTDSLTRHLRSLSGGVDVPRVTVGSGPARPEARGLIDSAWQHAARMLRAAPAAWDRQADLLEEVLLTSLLLELPTDAVRHLEGQASRSPAALHADRAVQWLQEQLTEPVTMARWAAGVGLSVRHLQKVFHDVYGCSPGDYVVQARLDRAHHLLLTSSTDRTVTSIATEVGFTHLGRFAALYRRRYGVAPSEARLRGVG